MCFIFYIVSFFCFLGRNVYKRAGRVCCVNILYVKGPRISTLNTGFYPASNIDIWYYLKRRIVFKISLHLLFFPEHFFSSFSPSQFLFNLFSSFFFLLLLFDLFVIVASFHFVFKSTFRASSSIFFLTFWLFHSLWRPPSLPFLWKRFAGPSSEHGLSQTP